MVSERFYEFDIVKDEDIIKPDCKIKEYNIKTDSRNYLSFKEYWTLHKIKAINGFLYPETIDDIVQNQTNGNFLIQFFIFIQNKFNYNLHI